MERNIWVISDTHFGHTNILKYSNRPFKDTEEMDWAMVKRWNSVVQPQDKVYHLGDVYFGSKERVDNILSSLNGRKRLILGNHDNGKDQMLQRHFEKISMWGMFPEYNVLLTHVPVHESSLRENRFKSGKMINVHGHIHTNPSPKGPYKCVCVEQTDYTPVNIKELGHG